jgi:hypothetical protein
MIFAACTSHPPISEETLAVKVPVTVSRIEKKPLTSYMELSATSRYLNKSVISAHAAGYIQKVYHDPGENVKRGDKLFSIQTKEAAALQNDSLHTIEFSGMIDVKAAINGMIISIDHPEGDFIMEGESLGSISVPSSLVFILEAPYEAGSLIKINSLCEILLPNGDSLKATISSRLPSMSESRQTQQFIVKPFVFKDIPENLIAKIRVIKQYVPEAITLPGKCILSDEIMQHFWVMKLANDSTAVRQEIKKGLTNGEDIEIIAPLFTMDDLFLSSGNYGVGDTISVNVMGIK